MKSNYYKPILLAISYFIATATGLCGVINHSVSLSHSDLRISEIVEDSTTHVIPELSGIESHGQYGQPILPRITLHFALPVYATDINLEVNSSSSPVHYSLSYPIALGADHISGMALAQEGTAEATVDLHTTPIAEIFHIENYKGLYKIASVVVNPVRESGDGIDLCENISISIYFNEMNINDDVDCMNPEDYELDMAFLRDMVENPEVIQSITPATYGYGDVTIRPVPRATDAYEYTIVTSEKLAPAFQRLVALKRLQGYDAGITTTEYIFGCRKYSKGDTISNICDSAGILKAYFMDNKDVIKFILLGGKPPIVPIRYGYEEAWEKYNWHIPSDLYYGTDETNWNYARSEDKYGSYYSGFGYSSLFKIGRLLCTTAEEVQNYIDKLEIYELNPGLGNRDYLGRAYCHISTDISRRNVSYFDTISNLMSSCFSFSKFEAGKDNRHTGKYVIDEMKNSYGFFNIWGHGNPEGISTIDDGDLGTNGINALDDETLWQREESENGLDNLNNFGQPNIMLTASCSTMPFDSPQYMGYGNYRSEANALTCNFAESFTLGKNYGGVGYIGNTRAALVEGARDMNIEFMKNLKKFGYSSTIAELLNFTRAKSNIVHKHIDRVGYNLVGDPSVCIWDGTTLPQMVTEPYEINRNFTDSIITVRLNTTGYKVTSVKNYSRLSVVEPNGKLLCATLTSKTPQVTFRHIDPHAIVYMSGNNILPYIGDLEIADNFDFSQHLNYIYSRNVKLGIPVDPAKDNKEKVRFSSAIGTTIDATGNVTLGCNVVVGDGKKASNLTIITPDTCYINSIEVNKLSKVTIYAGCVVLGDFFGNQSSLSRIDIHPYDKYGVNGKIQPNKIQQKSRSGEYKPLLEQGKTWRYSLVDWTRIAYPTFNPGRPTERVKEARLEGYETINGETYMKLNTYCYDEDLADYYNRPEYNNTMYYLREDTEAGKVYFYPNEDFWDYISWEDYPSQQMVYLEKCLTDQGLLYDFNATDGRNFSRYGTIEESTVTLADGEHRCFILDEDYYGDVYRVIEGIGLTGSGKRDAYIRGCSILGISLSSTFSTPDSYYNSYLYEVVNGDGEVIYSDENHRPGWWREVVGITDAVAQAKVDVTADAIIITGAPDMEATLCDMQGRVLAQRPTRGGSLALSTAGLAHGVYLLRLGFKTYKIAVK